MSVSSVQRAIKHLCDLGLVSYKNRCDEKGNKRTNLYQINVARLHELTSLPSNVVRMTPPTGHCDRRGTVTVTDKPLHPTFDKTSNLEASGSEIIATNFADRPITKKRMQEICEELGYDLT